MNEEPKAKLYGVGVGPGDPDLLTLKAVRLIQDADVIVWPAPDTGPSFARSIVEQYIPENVTEIGIIIPMKLERFPAQDIYEKSARQIFDHLDQGKTVVVLCEGDPFFYGSFMYLFDLLKDRTEIEIVPGVSSLVACASRIPSPLASRNDSLTILPSPLPDERIEEKMQTSSSIAFIKVGRHFSRIVNLIKKHGLLNQAWYVERATLENEKVLRLQNVTYDIAPYFSMILIYKGGELWR